MKKILMVGFLSSIILLAGCGNNTDTPRDGQGLPNNATAYSGELVVAGIGPEVSFEATVDSDVLVLKQTFEDHTDHLFLSRPFWDNYLDMMEDALPGNVVNFDGFVVALDAAAGNHYYEVVATDTLEKIRNATKEEVEAIIESYGFCESDEDCATTYGKCPLGCWITVNTKFLDITNQIVDNFWNTQENQCMYKCMEIWPVSCENFRCVISWAVADPVEEEPRESIAYQEEMKSFGIGPEVSFEAGINETDLVIRKTFEEHSDHIFIEKELWEQYVTAEDILPGNTLSFEGEIIWIDAGAGNHYYRATSIETLEKIWIPTQEEIEEILERFNYCEADSDCVDYYAECPFGCARGTNGKFLDISKQIIENYRNAQQDLCAYGCVATKGVSCQNYKCVVELETNQ